MVRPPRRRRSRCQLVENRGSASDKLASPHPPGSTRPTSRSPVGHPWWANGEPATDRIAPAPRVHYLATDNRPQGPPRRLPAASSFHYFLSYNNKKLVLSISLLNRRGKLGEREKEGEKEKIFEASGDRAATGASQAATLSPFTCRGGVCADKIRFFCLSLCLVNWSFLQLVRPVPSDRGPDAQLLIPEGFDQELGTLG